MGGANKYGAVGGAEQVGGEYDPLPGGVDPEKALEIFFFFFFFFSLKKKKN